MLKSIISRMKFEYFRKKEKSKNNLAFVSQEGCICQHQQQHLHRLLSLQVPSRSQWKQMQSKDQNEVNNRNKDYYFDN